MRGSADDTHVATREPGGAANSASDDDGDKAG